MMQTVLFAVAGYFIGAIPFGYLIARAKGVNLFAVGSGNIGATNVGRVLGRKIGILVFVLDFLKGAIPVAIADGDAPRSVATALAAVLGHMFPVYLGFRGGKGVATGAGTVFVLVPGPAGIALLLWFAAVSSTRLVSLASIIAAIALFIGQVLRGPVDSWVTIYCGIAAAVVIIKHRANLQRLLHGTEHRIEDRPMTAFLHRALHLLALGLWLGSAVFFNLLAAPTIFATFKTVAHGEPSDRTAFIDINSGLDREQKDQLASALAGSAVGPLFPIFFVLQTVCGAIALITAWGWWKRPPGKANSARVFVIGVAWALVVFGWPISQKVSELRLLRFASDPTIAAAAKTDFATWHLVSLGLSMLTILLTFVAMLLAAAIPQRGDEAPPPAIVD